MSKVVFEKKRYSRNSGSITKKVFLLIFLLILGVAQIGNTKFSCDFAVQIKRGDSFEKFLEKLPSLQRIKVKMISKLKDFHANKIKVGYYEFSGKCSASEFLQIINSGPTKKFVNFTVLEGRSSYDINYSLHKKGLITGNQYLDFVSSAENILHYSKSYSFLSRNLKTLEGYLYPDTYYIDLNLDTVPQLVNLQLKTFNQKVWLRIKDKLPDFFDRVKRDYGIKLDFYKLLIISSIVEKEEKNHENQRYVAGVFFNRLSKGMRLDADISLCYGLKTPYFRCNGKVIVENLSDKSNKYNTRALGGLPPTPIANPSLSTILAVLNYKKTNYLYYLHDKNGNIYLSDTAAQHNLNKQKYLR